MVNPKLYKFSWALLLILSLIELNRFYHHFAKMNTDSDQVIFWLVAKDISNAEHHGPYLYGQDYNIPLESYLCQPLLWLGVPVEKAMPLVGLSLMFLCFLLWALFFYKKQKLLSALICLSTTLLLPVEWLIITSSARGFIGGIIMANIGILMIYRDKGELSTLIGACLAFCSVLVNPNSVVLLIPFAINYLLNYKIQWRAILSALGTFLIVSLVLWRYKITHTTNVIHTAWSLEWSVQTFIDNALIFNNLFKSTVPIFYEAGASILLYLAVIYSLTIKLKNKKLLLNLVIFTLFILFSFGINKVNDGSNSVFFPYSRMYLGIPFVIILFCSELKLKLNKNRAVYALLAFSLIAFVLEQSFFSDRLERAIKTNSGIVQVMSVSELKQLCHELSAALDEEDAELVVFHSKLDVLNYGCSALNETKSYYPDYERRTWLGGIYKDKPIDKVLFIDWKDEITSQYPELNFQRLNNLQFPTYKIQESQLKLKDLYH